MTLEHKIDICLRYIAAQDHPDQTISAISHEAKQALTGLRPYNRKVAIEDLLKELGINSANQGWGYLRTAIELAMENENILHSITQILYPTIARKHGTTVPRVERSIRYAVDNAFTYGDIDAQFRVFGNATAVRGKPTNSAFIAGCVYELKRREGV